MNTERERLHALMRYVENSLLNNDAHTHDQFLGNSLAYYAVRKLRDMYLDKKDELGITFEETK